jgi:tripartite-type tricarboxylate transporter receptor subunit TctC
MTAFVRTALFAAIALTCSPCRAASPAAAQPPALPASFHAKPLRIIVTVPAGGSVDNVTRAMAAALTAKHGVIVVVDNRPGGTGTLAMNLTAQAAPDGHTLMSCSNSMLVTGVLKKVPYDIRRAFEPVVQLSASAYVLAVHPALPAANLRELIALAKARPGALKYGSPGVGSIIHLATERLNQRAGRLDMLHVPYKGNSMAIVDLLAGRLQVLVAAGVGVTPHIKAGRLRGIAVTGGARMPALAELPTLAEAGLPGLILDNTYGLYAPAGIAPALLAALNRTIGALMNTDEMRDKLAAVGAEPAPPRSAQSYKREVLTQIAELEQFLRDSPITLK